MCRQYGLLRDGVESLGDLRDARLVRADGHEVRGVGRDLLRPDDALVVVVGLDDAGDVAPEADPVRAHDDRVALAVLAEVHRPNASVKSVPSLKMLPTSMPLRSFTGEPHVMQASPPRAFGISATTSGVVVAGR